MPVREAVRVLRPKQWTKNVIVFAALIFSQSLFDWPLLMRAVGAFASFCLMASVIYVINDVRDIEEDRRHPTKRYRPIPSGAVSVGDAASLAAVCGVASIGLAIYLGGGFVPVLMGYFALMLAYNFGLKHAVILDAIAIAAGFVLRAVAGSEVIGKDISPWLLICTFLLALFLAFGKRRQELRRLREEATDHRRVLAEYTVPMIDQLLAVVAGATIASYCIYTLSESTVTKFGTTDLVYTVPFVVYGIFRYYYLVHKAGEGDAPDRVLLTDIPLQVCVALFVLVAGIILY
ncbi:MAG: decaprenyl-phosphate phosphoribosyltransferase [Armatimonadota bacterium]